MQSRQAPTSQQTSESRLRDQLANAAADVERHLATILDQKAAHNAAKGVPERLLAAMRHGVLSGGKRFRPFLVFTCAELFKVPRKHVCDAAAAIELIHCYSLVHDDMPAMDNDRLRRGQPTVWAAYDEWTAILVGDALQTLAFDVIANSDTLAADVRLRLIGVLADAAGARGMVGGQALDLEADKLGHGDKATADHIARLQAMKTGRLIAAACEMGGILGGAQDSDQQALRRYGDAIGLAFQISDDLLDAEGCITEVGKATGKDADAGKATFVSLLGVEASRQRLDTAVKDACKAVESFGDNAARLIEAANYIATRKM